MNMKIRKITAIFAITAAVLVFSCAGGAEVVAPKNVLSIPGWDTSSPEAQGMDSELLTKAVNVVMKNEIHGLVITRNGIIVSETYRFPGAPDKQHAINSCTKSITSTLVGIAIDKGYIESADQSMWDFFPEVDRTAFSEMKQKVTIKHLLTMTGGFEWNERAAGLKAFREWIQNGNHVAEAYNREVTNEPGSFHNYDTLQSHLLSAIIERATGQNPLDFAKTHLFNPLEITNFHWPFDDGGIPWGGSNSYFTTRDMAKLGLLYLNKGLWNGEQIISSEWITESGKPHIGTDAHTGTTPHYGYQFWVEADKGYYTAVGYGGQIIAVIPEYNIVVAANSYTSESLILSIIEKYVIPSVQGNAPIKSNPDGLTALRDLEKKAAVFSEPTVEPLPISQASIEAAGKVYNAEEGSSWFLKSISFEFTDGAAAGSFILNGRAVEVGLNNQYRYSEFTPPQVGKPITYGYKGYWKNDSTFYLQEVLDTGVVTEYKLKFMNGKVIVMWKNPYGTSYSMTMLAE